MCADTAAVNANLLTPAQALVACRQWSTVEDVGASEVPVLAVDLRGLDRSFRKDDQDRELAQHLVTMPSVNVGVIDDALDPSLASLAEAFDVMLSETSTSDIVVATSNVESSISELCAAIHASPDAAVELVRLLRTSHDLPVAQALHAESLTYAVLQTGVRFQQWLAARSPTPAPIEDTALTMQLEGSLLRITLERPHKRNALNVTMRDQLAEALALVDLDAAIDGAILAGAGSNFCAGGDLDEFGTTPSPAVGHQVRMLRSLPALMHRVSDRVRVHVHGSCVGAGIELPAFASSIIAHSNATFRLPEIAFGLVPGAGGTVSVTRRCGRHRTAWLALTGTAIDATTALQWQLVDRIDDSVFS